MQVADSPLTLETPDFRARRGYSQHTPPPPHQKKNTPKKAGCTTLPGKPIIAFHIDGLYILYLNM